MEISFIIVLTGM